ncbi:MAG: DUF4097 family beta strand repeat-containing protein [Eubacterium sp.]
MHQEKDENTQSTYSNGTDSRKENVSFKNGIHVDDGNDKVDISWRGIHVESKNGDSVHISPNGDNHINVKGEQVKNPWLHALLPLCAVVFYLAVGFYTDRGWACGWIVFLFIPIIESTFSAIKAKNPSHFCYPVLATAVFLICGMVFGIWHPTWIVFLTIPAYYALCDAYKKSRQGNDDADGTKNYYTPDGIDSNAPLKKSNAAAVITSVLCAILILAVTGIIGVSAFRSGSLGTASNGIIKYDNSSAYLMGSAQVPAQNINSISVEWVSEEINASYYDGNTISFKESGSIKNDSYKMRYIVEDNELKLKYCQSGLNIPGNFSGKELTLLIPQDMPLSSLDIDNVSSDITVNDISASKLSCDTVSGNASINGSFSFLEFDSVSGEINAASEIPIVSIDASTISGGCCVTVPSQTGGFNLDYETVSGRINLTDFYPSASKLKGEGEQIIGDGSTAIDFESISGDLVIKKAG